MTDERLTQVAQRIAEIAIAKMRSLSSTPAPFLVEECVKQAAEAELRAYAAEVIEACAKVAENEEVDFASTRAECDGAYNTALVHAAAAIRAQASTTSDILV